MVQIIAAAKDRKTMSVKELTCSLCFINHNFRWKWVLALFFGSFTSRDKSSRYSMDRWQGGHHKRLSMMAERKILLFLVTLASELSETVAVLKLRT